MSAARGTLFQRLLRGGILDKDSGLQPMGDLGARKLACPRARVLNLIIWNLISIVASPESKLFVTRIQARASPESNTYPQVFVDKMALPVDRSPESKPRRRHQNPTCRSYIEAGTAIMVPR
jgi:hypothetical protein